MLIQHGNRCWVRFDAHGKAEFGQAKNLPKRDSQLIASCVDEPAQEVWLVGLYAQLQELVHPAAEQICSQLTLNNSRASRRM